MDGQDRVCPVCGRTVEAVVHRHKTLGAWVPVWGPGPCRHPDCAGNRRQEQQPPAPPPAPESQDGTEPPTP
ncbi:MULTISPECIES: hypothetical protein [unclassified Streptomyces]|jgi:hypothetical protein|uniref:hypothetical protein n=1 Tax=unclassified Streptomyces TaxID=2593676 RepID=UPI00343156E3